MKQLFVNSFHPTIITRFGGLFLEANVSYRLKILMWWSLLPNVLRPFKIYCASQTIISQLVLFLWKTVEIGPLGHARVEALQNLVQKCDPVSFTFIQQVFNSFIVVETLSAKLYCLTMEMMLKNRSIQDGKIMYYEYKYSLYTRVKS